MNKLAIVLFLCAAFLSAFILSPHKASASEQVSVWWPVDSVTIRGTQPFKALIDGKDITQYQMFWSVDNGQHNVMETTMADAPHKEASVDVSGWTWNGNGPYTVTFIAKDWQGTTLGQKSVTFSVSPESAEPVATPTPSDVPTTPSPTPIPEVTTTVIETPTPSPTSVASPSPSLVAPVKTDTVTQTNSTLYVDPESQAQAAYGKLASTDPAKAVLVHKIASQPQAKWFGGWNSDIYTDVYVYTWNARVANKTPVMVLYNIPNRDCGGYSQGGATTKEQYMKWVSNVANGIGGTSTLVILEPDSLALMDCLSAAEKQERYSMLKEATSLLQAKGANVYLDAGHPNWVASQELSVRLKNAGISKADGFTLNTSNYVTTNDNVTFGKTISSLTGGKHFVIDTSRNGRGPSESWEWCNPSGRALGEKPTTETGNPLVDAYLWIKRPGESDGNCNGGPNAGAWWTEYAVGLSERAAW